MWLQEARERQRTIDEAFGAIASPSPVSLERTDQASYALTPFTQSAPNLDYLPARDCRPDQQNNLTFPEGHMEYRSNTTGPLSYRQSPLEWSQSPLSPPASTSLAVSFSSSRACVSLHPAPSRESLGRDRAFRTTPRKGRGSRRTPPLNHQTQQEALSLLAQLDKERRSAGIELVDLQPEDFSWDSTPYQTKLSKRLVERADRIGRVTETVYASVLNKATGFTAKMGSFRGPDECHCNDALAIPITNCLSHFGLTVASRRHGPALSTRVKYLITRVTFTTPDHVQKVSAVSLFDVCRSLITEPVPEGYCELTMRMPAAGGARSLTPRSTGR